MEPVYLELGESAAPPGAAERRPPLYGWWILKSGMVSLQLVSHNECIGP